MDLGRSTGGDPASFEARSREVDLMFDLKTAEKRNEQLKLELRAAREQMVEATDRAIDRRGTHLPLRSKTEEMNTSAALVSPTAAAKPRQEKSQSLAHQWSTPDKENQLVQQ